MGMGFVFAILSAVLFGLMPMMTKEIYLLGGNPLSVSFYRFLFSIPFLLAAARGKDKRPLDITKKQAIQIGILSLGSAGTPFLLFQSYEYISSGMATTIHFIYPVLVLLGSILFFGERLTWSKGICTGLCLAGMLCFYTPGSSGSTLGIALALGSGITYAFYILYFSRSGLASINRYKMNFYLSLFGALELLVLASVSRQLVLDLPLKGWALAIGLAFLMSVLATIFFQMGVRKIGPERASLLSTFEPLTSVVVGILLYGEPFTAKSMMGMGFILLSVILLAGDRKK